MYFVFMQYMETAYLLTGELVFRVRVDVGEYSVDIECLLFGDGLLLSKVFLA